MSKLFYMRISVSMGTPKAFSIRNAISGDSLARSLRKADNAALVTPKIEAAPVTVKPMIR